MTEIKAVPQFSEEEAAVLLRKARPRYSFELEFEMDFVPYSLLAEGNDYESLLENAQYNYMASDDGTKYRDIGNLPAKKYEQVCQLIASEIAAHDEHHLERLRDR